MSYVYYADGARTLLILYYFLKCVLIHADIIPCFEYFFANEANMLSNISSYSIVKVIFHM